MGRKTEQSKTVYDAMAQTYDTSKEGLYTRAHRRELLHKVKLLDGDMILDVACGNGDLLGEFAKQAKVHAFGIDLSEQMILHAKKRHPACEFKVGNCVPLDFSDSSMDIITLSCAFHHFEDPVGFVKECLRILKKGGHVYIAEPYFPPLVRMLANTIVFPFAKSGDVKVYNQTQLWAFFEQAGFQNMSAYQNGTVLFLTAQKPH